MKKHLLYFILFICFLLFTNVGFASKKKTLPIKEKLNITSSAEFGIIKEMIYYEILNGEIVSVNLDSYAQKSATTEDSIPYFKISADYLSNQFNQVYSTWDSLSQSWIAVIKDEIYYDTDPWSPDSSIYYDIDTTSGNWIAARRNIYSYNAEGMETEHMAYIYNDTSQIWDKESRTVSEYDVNNKLFSETLFYWSPLNIEWIALTKDTFIWDGGLQIESQNKIWDTYSDSWYANQKQILQYDAFNRLETQSASRWDYWGDKFEPQGKVVYTYVEESEFFDAVYSLSWNLDSSAWTAVEMDIYNYKTNKELIASIDVYTPPLDNKSANENQSMQKNTSIVYLYNDDATNVVENGVPEIMVYPNPITNKVILLVPKPMNCSLEVFNIQGKLLKTATISNPSTTINTEGFQKGMYFFRINNNGEQITKKVIKQ